MTDDHQCALAPFTTTEEPPERISEYDTEGALEGEGGAGGAGVEKDDKLAPLLSHEEKKCQVTPEAIASLNYMRIFTPPRPRQRWIVNQNADHHKDHRPNHHTNQEHDAEQLGHLQEPSPAPPPGPQYLNTLSLSHEHRAAEPADLVLDLVFVVMLAGLGASFRAELFESEDASVGIAIRDFVAMFLPIWFQWNVINHYNNRFETHDMVNLVYFAGNFILSAVAGASSERCGSATSRKGCQEFAWAIAGARLWTVLFTFYAAYHNKRYSVAIFQYTVFDILVIILWMATSFMHSGEYCGSEVNKCWIPFIFLWWLTLLIDTCRLFLAPILSSKLKLVKNRLEMIPLDVSLLAERHELFIILSIGEVVVSALAGGVSGHSGDDEHHRRLQDGHTDDESGGGDDGGQNEYEMVIVIVCIAFAIKTWYFDLYDPPKPTGATCAYRKHAMSVSPYHGLTWIFLHIPLNIAIVMTGSVLEPLKLEGDFDVTSSRIIGTCLAIIVGCCTGFDLLHSGCGVQLRKVGKKTRVAVHVVFMFALLLVPFLWDFGDNPSCFLWVMLALMMVGVVSTFYMHRPLYVSEKALEAPHDHGIY